MPARTIHEKQEGRGRLHRHVVSTLLDRLHGAAADYTITVPEALLEQSRRIQRRFDIVMGAIAGIALLVGGIGIMNIMPATALERTREIEAVTGGLLGIAMGLAIAAPGHP